jgi:hypothetical protein
MKGECEYTRKRLERYLNGRLFKIQLRRIARHLSVCAICSSEFDAVRRIDETKRILRDVDSPDASPFVRIASRAVPAVRRLLYRPLWLSLILCSLVALYLYVLLPMVHDPDLERLDASLSEPVAAPDSTRASGPTPTAVHEAGPSRRAPKGSSAQEDTRPDPLIVSVVVDADREKATIQRINEAMKEHALLKSMRFSDTVREISGSLTANELKSFFDRIQDAGKITYKRSRLASAGETGLLPFVVRIKVAPPAHPAEPEGQTAGPGEMPAQKPVGATVAKPVENSAEKPVENSTEKPVEKPVHGSADRPIETPASVPASSILPPR